MGVNECPSILGKHVFKLGWTSVCCCSHHGNTQLMPGKAVSVSVVVRPRPCCIIVTYDSCGDQWTFLQLLLEAG